MFRTWWVKRLFGRRAVARKSPAKHRPQVVRLEDRTVPAYTWGTNGAGLLTITAGAGDVNDLAISYVLATDRYTFSDFGGNVFNVGTDTKAALISGDTTTTLVIDGSKISDISVDLGNQDDSVVVNSLGDPLTVAGGSNADTLVGPDAVANWTISGTNSGTMTGAGANVTYSGFSNLVGGSAADVFGFAVGGSHTGTISGGGGTDKLDYNVIAAGVTVDIGAGTATGVGVLILSIEDVRGGTGNDTLTGGGGPNTFFASKGNDTIAGGGGIDVLVAVNSTNTWTLTGGDDGTLTWAGHTTTFADVANLTGGTGIDVFVVSGGTLSGMADGGAGVNSLTADNVTNAWSITGANAGSVTGVAGFVNIGTLTGGSGKDTFTLAGGSVSASIDGGTGANTLVGGNGPNSWTVTGANAGTIGGVPAFTNIGSLTGGTGADTFTLAGGTISTKIDGGTGANALTGDNITSTWSITGANAGSVTGVAAFTNIGALTGGSGTDTFTLAVGTISGKVDGGGGSNTLVGGNAANTWTVTTANGGTVNGVGAFANIGTLTGGSGADNYTLAGGTISTKIDGGLGTNTLTADNVANTWSATGANAGSVTGVPAFTNIGTLVGGSGTDSFTLSGVTSATAIDGGAGANTLTGDNVAASWSITGANAGSVGLVTFSNIATLTGGTGADTFTLAGGAISNKIDGGPGTNTLVAGNAANTWTVTGANAGTVNGGSFANIGSLTGGTGNDSFTLAGGTVTGKIDGGGGLGANTLTADNVTNTWVVSGPNAGTVTGAGSFANIGTLNGGTANDTFTVNSYGTTNLAVNGGLPAAAPGDTLVLDAQNKAVTSAPGSLTVGTLLPVLYSGIESFAVSNASETIVNGTPLSDTLALGKVGGALSFSLNGAAGLPVFGPKFTFNGLAGSDNLTIDYTGGTLGLAGGVVYDGGSGGVGDSDSLTLQNGTTTAVTHKFLSLHDGSVALTGALSGTVAYTGLEPITDTLVAGARTFDYFGGVETITVADTGGADGKATIASTLGESVIFTNPTALLTIQTTSGTGADLVTVTSLDAAFKAALTVTAAAGDTVTLSPVLDLGSATSTGAVTIAAGTINLTADISTNAGPTDAGAITFTGNVTLLADIAIDASATGTDGAVSFNGTVNGAKYLTVTTGATTTFGGAVGNTAPLISLTTDATGTTAINGGTVKTTGTQTFNDAVTVGANAVFDSSAGAVAFGSTLDGTTKVTATSAAGATFGGAVGNGSAPASLTVNGAAAVNGGSVKTSGAQTYNAAVSLGANAVFTAGGDVTFSGSLTGAGKQADVFTGGVTRFSGAVTLDKLTTDTPGSTVVNTSTVTTTNDLSFGDPVTVLQAVTFDGANVTFAKTLDGGFDVAVNSGGVTTFGGAVGTTPLASLKTDAGGTTKVDGGAVTTTGFQSFDDPVALGVTATFTSTGGKAIAFGAALDGPGGAVVNTGGATTFTGPVGAGAALASLKTDVLGTTAINSGSVKTTGDQFYGDPVTVAIDTGFTSTGNGAITFNSTLTGGGKWVAVTTGGVTKFSGAVTLGKLTTDTPGSTVVNTAAVTTTNDLSFGDPVTVVTAVVFDGANVTFAKTLDGGFDVAVNSGGVTTFGGAVGTTPLASLKTNAGGTTKVNGGAVTTTGLQTYADPVILGTAATFTSTGGQLVTFSATLSGAGATVNTTGTTTFSGAVATATLATDVGGTTVVNTPTVTTTLDTKFGDAVTVNQATTFTAGTDVRFGGTLTGVGQDVNVKAAGVTTFGGAVVLANLATDAPGTTAVNGGSVTTTGSQLYSDPVTVGAAATFASTAGPITFASTLDGVVTVAVNTAGVATFGGAVGASQKLTSLTTDAPGSTQINGGSVAAGTLTFGDPVTLGANTTISVGAVAFKGTLNGPGRALSVAGVTASFGGAVAVGSVAVAVTGGIAVGGGSVVTTDSQNWNRNTSAGADTTFNSTGGGPITFVDGLSAPGKAVVVLTAGATSFAGGAVVVGKLTTDGPGSTVFSSGVTVTATGSLIFNDPATALSDVPFAAGGAVTFAASFGGGGKVSVASPGATTFGGTVTIGSLTTDAPGSTTVAGGSVSATAGLTFGDPVDTTLATTFSSNGDVTFGSTLSNPCLDVVVNAAGTTTFAAAVNVGSVVTDGLGNTVVGGGPVITCTFQTYGDSVAVTAATTFTSTGAGAITFRGTLTGPGRAVAIDTAGDTEFDGPVTLGSLATDTPGRTVVNTGAVTTAGAQTFNDPVLVAVTATFAATAAGPIAFNSALDSNAGVGVTVNTDGLTRFGGAVGTTGPLGTLTTDAPGSTAFGGPSATATTSLTFNDPVATGPDIVFSAPTLAFRQTLTAANKVTLSGQVGTFDAAVTAGALATNLPGGLTVNGTTVTTTGDQTYGNAVTAGPAGLVLSAATLTAAGDVTSPAGVAVTTTGAQTYNGRLTAGGSAGLVLNGAAITFAGDVTSAADVSLTTTGGGVAQTGGKLVTPDLGLFGSGPFLLEQSGNDVTTGGLRVNLTGGSVRLFDQNDLVVATASGGIAVINGDVFLRAGGSFTAVDPRTDAAKYSTALVQLGAGTLIVQPGVSAGATVLFDVEIAAAGLQLAQPAGGNNKADLFKVRPSATTPIAVSGNGPTAPLPAGVTGDRLFPFLVGLTVTNFQSTGVSGFYEFAGRAKLTFSDIESLQRRAFSGFVLQTGEPRDGSNARGLDYAVRIAQTQDGVPLTGGLSGSSLPQNPFVVSPSRVNPYSPSSAPRIEFADVNGDGSPDLILAAGPGSAPLVTVIDGNQLNVNPDGSLKRLEDLPAGAILAQFYAYDPRFQGGINLSAGDLDGNGVAEIVTGAEIGGGPHVRRFALVPSAPGAPTPLTAVQPDGPLASFFAFEPTFTGGVRISVADVNHDGRDDLVIGAGINGGPRVTVLDGRTGGEIANFFAYDPGFRGGIYVDAGDYDGDGYADVLTGPGFGGGAHVRVFSGRTALGGAQPVELAGFLAFPQTILADPLFAAAGGLNGVGGVAFGAGSTTAASRDILVTTPRGTATKVYEYFGNARTPDARLAADLTGAIYSDPLLAAQNRLPYIPSSNPPAGSLTYGGTTGGFLDQSE